MRAISTLAEIETAALSYNMYHRATYFFVVFGDPSLSLFTLPLVLLMPVVSILPSSLAPFVIPGFSMPVCGAGPVFGAEAELRMAVRAMIAVSVFIRALLSSGDMIGTSGRELRALCFHGVAAGTTPVTRRSNAGAVTLVSLRECLRIFRRLPDRRRKQKGFECAGFGAAMMSKPVEEILQSILDEFAASRQSREELEAKALFRLLNCCPPTELEKGASGRHESKPGREGA
jgi:hypothetical protein